MTTQELITQLESFDACIKAQIFVEKFPTAQAAWDACERPDWLLFYIERAKPANFEKNLRLAAADIAESVLHIWQAQYPNDQRPARAIEVARAFAEGRATEAELQEARQSATACAAYAAAAYAAAAYADAAAIATAYVATYADAADAAYAAAAAYAAYATESSTTQHVTNCNIIRKHFPTI